MVSKSDAMMAVAVATVLSMTAGVALGTLHGMAIVTKQAAERGYMTQCIGKTGWHWECNQ